jgi:hypothetical protein
LADDRDATASQMNHDRSYGTATWGGLSNAAWFGIACLAIVLIALALRLAGLSYDMPFIYGQDEQRNLAILQDMLRNGTANPKAFNYPSLFYYLQVPGQIAVEAISGTLQRFTLQSMGNGYTPQPVAFLVARATTACIGVGVVIGTMLLAREISSSRWTILLVGALAAFNPLLIVHSRMITPDVTAAFFVVFALIAAVRIVKVASMTNYIFGGVMTGLAASSKYNAGLVGISMAASHFLNYRLSTSCLYRLILSGIVSIVIFLLTSPFVILDFHHASAAILSEIHHYQTGHAGYEGHALTVNLVWIWEMFGLPVLLIFLSAFHPARIRIIPISIFALAYFTLLAVQVVRFDRNLMPLIPALIVQIGVGFELVRLLLERWMVQSRLRTVLMIALTCAVFSPGLAEAISETTSNYSVDPRRDARAWVIEHAAPGSSILEDSYTIYSDPKNYHVSGESFVLKAEAPTIEANDIVVISLLGSGRFLRDGQTNEGRELQRLGQIACERAEFKNAYGITAIWVFRLHC